jgi:hypothetical protein
MSVRAQKLQLTEGATLVGVFEVLVTQKWASHVVNGQTVLITAEASGSVTFTLGRAFTPAELAVMAEEARISGDDALGDFVRGVTIGDATVADALLNRLVHNASRLELDALFRRHPQSAPADDPQLRPPSGQLDRGLGHPKTGPRRTLQTAGEGSNGPVCSGATPFWDGPGRSLFSPRNPRVAFGSEALFQRETLDLNSDSGLRVSVKRRSAPESVRIEPEMAVRIFSETRVRFRRNPQ